MGKGKFPEERAFLEGGEGQQLFPHLGSAFEVLGPATWDYNCIAHSLGWNNQWMNPQTGPANEPLAIMDLKYQVQGFARSATLDLDWEPGKQKVVLYALKHVDGSIREITHAALQESSGTWSSKLGQGPLIRHETPQALCGPVYGEPVAVYVK